MITGFEVLKIVRMPREHLAAELAELGAAMIDRRLGDGGEHRQGRVGGPGNLQEMPAWLMGHVDPPVGRRLLPQHVRSIALI